MKRYEMQVIGGKKIVALNHGTYSYVMYHEQEEVDQLERLNYSNLVLLTVFKDGKEIMKDVLMEAEKAIDEYIGPHLYRPWSLIKFREIKGPTDINFDEVLE